MKGHIEDILVGGRPMTKNEIKIKELQDRIDKAIEYINEMTLTSDGYANYGDDLRPEHIIDILRGSEQE